MPGLQRPDAIIVLGCALVFAGGRLTGALARRVDAGVRTFVSAGAEPVVIVTGGRAWDGTVEADGMQAALVERGIPLAKIVRERCSLSTRENARFTARVLRRHGLSRVAVVTCFWHLPRASALFRAEGLAVTGVPAGGDQGARPSVWLWGRERVAARLDGL